MYPADPSEVVDRANKLRLRNRPPSGSGTNKRHKPDASKHPGVSKRPDASRRQDTSRKILVKYI